MNLVVLKGNLTRDPEAKAVGSSTVANFGIAVNESYKKANGDKVDSVSFFDCEVWDKAAEYLASNASKGSPVLITGKLRTQSWEKEGKKQTKVVIRVESFDILNGKKEQSSAKQETVGANAESSSAQQDSGDGIPF